ncbi:FAD-binding domain-containing protein [Artomyces pyxidatus]|uniref:FAD-binding domain-containing protein n=1 Tax=Artomyces pyxidatus TaxID=48021 RepID=A0ACB8SRH6_9AGAM|nr:FAD-binding domain-containing protein [Artomyces pyxidatus]
MWIRITFNLSDHCECHFTCISSILSTQVCKPSGYCRYSSNRWHSASTSYESDISHWAVSSSAISTCSVEPGTAADVGIILRALASSRTPFAVKGGGHTTNPGFSSTAGVEIAMTRFSQISVDAAAQTVSVGAGLTWDQVYAALDPMGVNVVGGRVPGVGVAGVTLGGGYSWKSNQHGLAIDNIEAYELVLPNGTFFTVTETQEDLWFGLRGGFNNFGIVTTFTFKSYPQTAVWAGTLVVSIDNLDDFNTALANYGAQADEKAAVIAGILQNSSIITAMMVYDSPSPPTGLFDELIAIPTIGGVAKTTTLSGFVSSLTSAVGSGGSRALYSCAPVLRYTPALLAAIANETAALAQQLGALDPTVTVVTVAEPFQEGLFSHGAPSAYPPDRARALLPTNPYITWKNASLDSVMHDALWGLTQRILAAASAEGQDVTGAALYPNYAPYDTPLENLYGANLPRLRALREKYDPADVMGLAGGFKF